MSGFLSRWGQWIGGVVSRGLGALDHREPVEVTIVCSVAPAIVVGSVVQSPITVTIADDNVDDELAVSISYVVPISADIAVDSVDDDLSVVITTGTSLSVGVDVANTNNATINIAVSEAA